MLQKFCECLEHTELLDRANNELDPCVRILLVAAFAFSSLH